jgi:hypothetical protein
MNSEMEIARAMKTKGSEVKVTRLAPEEVARMIAESLKK